MKLTTSLLSLVILTTSCLGISVSYDNFYDNPASSTDVTACSTGPHGLAGRFPTLGTIPSFPNIGGAPVVAGFGSPNCGTCWSLTYMGNKINVLVIDAASSGFNIAQAAMDKLTNNQAVFLGRINATSAQVAASACGL